MPDIAELMLQLSGGGALRLTQESISLQVELHHSNQQCNKVQSILEFECEIKSGPSERWPFNRKFTNEFRLIPQCAGH